ncbi:MAG: TetR/AcrR family transcriptional regulator [Candidatus Caenarcaniphilales bacterium]|nr:TetR/AcrR family transcriptional regulator [Candidatus Caenarcaniphilales bacterium]
MQTASSRDKILLSAFELFTSKGFQVTTTQEIADKAQVNQVTLFRNFTNKQRLLQAVLEEFLVPKLVFSLNEDDLFAKYENEPEKFFKALAMSVAEKIKLMLPFMKMQILETSTSHLDEEILNTLSQVPTRSRKKLESVFKKCVERNWIEDRESFDPLIVSLYGPFFAYFMNLSKFKNRVFQEPESFMIEQIANNFVKACL